MGSGPVVGFLLRFVGHGQAPAGMVVTRIGAALRAGAFISAIDQVVERWLRRALQADEAAGRRPLIQAVLGFRVSRSGGESCYTR